MRGSSWFGSLLLIMASVAASCGRGKSASERAEPAPTSPASPADAGAPRRADTTPAYLVIDGGAVWQRGGTAAPVKLAEGVAEAAYDPALELLWISTANQLSVVDLRTPGTAPVPIVTGMAGSNFVVARGDSRVETGWDDGVVPGMPYRTQLSWGPTPMVVPDLAAPTKPAPDVMKAAERSAAAAKVVGDAWLKAQAGRSSRPAPAGSTEERHFDLPDDIGDCETEHLQCGDGEPFGTTGWWLVYARASYLDEGFTSSYECVLHDAETSRWAVPPDTMHWGPLAVTAKLGSCGPYRFDDHGTSFLVGDQVCKVGAACAAAGGRTLGWRDPGATVGRGDDT